MQQRTLPRKGKKNDTMGVFMSKILEISPSMLFQYAKSPHWIWYDIHGDQSKKIALSELTLRLIEGGVLHEEECVKDMQKVVVDKNLSEMEAEKLTLKYMQNGEEFIYQGVISYIDGDVRLKGRPDFLKKLPGSSTFGDYYYIPIEIKNSTKCDKPEYKKQLMLYALILEGIQGHRPVASGFINKSKQEVPCELTDKLLKDTNETIGNILSILRGVEPPLKITKAALDTPWAEVLFDNAINKSDISLLYDIRSSVVSGLNSEGIDTLNKMAECDVELLPKIKDATIDTLRRLHKQAKSLANNVIIPIEKPDIPDSKIKIYFDIEGDPLLGVEYLFGFWIVKEGEESIFKYFLAEKPEDEEMMWNDFLTWLKNGNIDNYKVYHFHHYEKTQLTKLANKYGGSEQLNYFVDNLVDLSPLTINSYIFPLYFYSIKDIAKHLKFEWRSAKAGGAQSIFWYEEWLEKNDRKILQDIINYNEDDVRATEFLHNWLNKQAK